jgi:hypothetical protein
MIYVEGRGKLCQKADGGVGRRRSDAGSDLGEGSDEMLNFSRKLGT